MAARKGASKAAAAAPAAAAAAPHIPVSGDEEVALSKGVTGSEPAPDAAVRFAPAADRDDDRDDAEQDPPRPPVQRYVAPKPAPFRAGGHVLTERGWVLDTSPEQEH